MIPAKALGESDMQFWTVIIAAAAAYVFGAVWYMGLSRAWLSAAGIAVGPDGRPLRRGAMPFVIGAALLILVAGMMRHIFQMAGLDTFLEGLMGGFGLGAFIVLPWIAMNYVYAGRPRNLTLIDGGYAVIACTIMGIVLGTM